MKKRITSFMLVLALLLTALPMVSPLTANAANGIEVYVTIANKGEVTVAQEKITVVDRNADGKYSVDEAMYAAHEAYYPGGASAGYASSLGYYGTQFDKLWGDTSYNFGYNNNHAMCMSADDELQAGDYLVTFVYQVMAYPVMDVYARFVENSYETKVNDKVDVTLQTAGYDEQYNLVYTAKSGATVKLYDENHTAVATDKYQVSDNGDGTYSVKVTEAGTYKLIAMENDTPIVPAVCRLSVGKQAQENIGNESGDNDNNNTNTDNGTVNKNHKGIVANTATYLQGLKNVGYGSEWLVIGLTRAGYDCPKGYYNSVVSYVKENINENEQLSATKATENARVILALTASGYDASKVGGHNLLKGLTDMSYVKKQGINGPIWTLLAFDSADYKIPTDKNAKEQVTREKLIDFILANQLQDGGWAFSGSTADPDMTGMALQALAPYYNKKANVKQAVDKALACLSEIQYDNGGFGATGNNAPSCAQVIVALTALGINPHTDSRFVKNGRSVVDALSTFALADGGFTNVVGGERNALATEQGMYAMTAYLRFEEGKTSLYDMSDVQENQDDDNQNDNAGEQQPDNQDEQKDTQDNNQKDDDAAAHSPQTGDSASATVFVMIAAACVILVALKKKQILMNR